MNPAEGGRVEMLAAALRQEGLDANLDDIGVIQVGPRARGAGAPSAVVVVSDAGLQEFLVELTERWGDSRPDLALDRAALMLMEYLTSLHDGGDSNLTTAVRLERDSRGHLALRESRSGASASSAQDGDDHVWTPER